MMKNISNKSNVLIIQRAIPHYRMPLFKALNNSVFFNLTLCIGKHNSKTATGLAAENYSNLNIINADVKNIFKDLLFQKIINLKKFDVIITDISINLISVPIYIVYARLLGIKVIGWGKGIPQETSKKENAIKRRYKKLIASMCNGLILYGEISRKYYIDLGLENKYMVVAQNSIDTQSLMNSDIYLKKRAYVLKTEMNLSEKFVFGYFGKLTSRKQVDKILISFLRFKDINITEAVLIIAGTGIGESHLKDIAKNSKHKDSVIFLGKIAIGQEGVIINLFDAFLSFSQGGLGILEAMSLSKLIISTPEIFPETELLENNYNCLLSADFSVNSFAETMSKAILLNEERRVLEKNVFHTVKQKATIEKMVLAFENAIKN
jgi:glycosyltransferase involved in cell wall biosynthesis